MKKHSELIVSDSTLNKAADHEMLFILRGKDFTAPKTIILWIAENIDTAPPDKLREALECAIDMRTTEGRKLPG